MKTLFKTIWQGLIIRLLRLVESMSERLPRKSLLRLGSAFGVISYHISKRYRKVALKNLGFAYGDTVSRADKLRIVKAVFVNFAKSAVEFPLASRMSDDEIRRLVEFRSEDAERLRNLEHQYGSILGVSAHFGNFELMARRYVAEGFKASVVVRNDNNQAVADLLNGYRNQTGYEVIPRGAAIRSVLRKLRSAISETVVMLPDQKSDDVFVPFFGKLAGTVAGPALVALKTNCPIVPVFCVRNPDDTHKIVFGEFIQPAATGDPERDIESIMTAVNLAIEAIIREYPEQWLWLHDRWRGQPPPDAVERWNARLHTAAELSRV